MPTEIVVETEDRPGIIADVGELFGRIGVNISAAAAFTHGGRGFLHFVVDHADKALAALHDEDWSVVQAREVLAVSLDDRPGELGRFARRLSDAGVNISALYISGQGTGEKELVVAVDDMASARPHI